MKRPRRAPVARRRPRPRPAAVARTGPRRRPAAGPFRTIRLEGTGGVAIVTLDRPEARNAISREMVDELHAVLDALADSGNVRALILTGAGSTFASGADIRELQERRAEDALRGINSTLFLKVEQFPSPTIAAVNGHALGGGCELAIACDLRLASESARFGQPEAALGIMPAAGATYRLPRLVGLGRARDLIYTGRIIDAAEALRIGLVNHVVPGERLLDEARALAATIASRSPLALRAAKMVLAAAAPPAEPARMAENLGQAILFESEDKTRRMAEFLRRGRTKRRGA